MIFDELGYPKVQGADDWADSPHLAGILALVDHPQAVNCREYLTFENGQWRYVRHPNEKRYDFSRDQFILLAAGLWAQGGWSCVDTNYITGRDIIPPSVQGMVRIIKGKKPYFWQRWDFEAEFETNVTIQKLEEPFQVIAMCMVYGDGYLERWTRENNLWKWAIRRYLCELDGKWRNEPELAEFVIKAIENLVK